jgi:erythromycin esterase-like protein
MSNRKIGILLGQLHDAETDLAAEFREVAQRQAAEHDVFYLCQTLAQQCDDQAQQVRSMAERFDHDISAPDDQGQVSNVMSALRRKTSELMGRRPEAGMLLLRDLRQLYLMAEEANVHWIALGQVAQAVRDHDLLGQVSLLHKQTLTQIKWIKTRLREATPQVLCTG